MARYKVEIDPKKFEAGADKIVQAIKEMGQSGKAAGEQLDSAILSAICDHAKSEFPNECCGVILGTETQEFVRKCRNIQNELHQEDPDTYPRDAHTAYVIHPDDLIAVHKEADTQQRQIKAFYHSHPNHKAYFSEKDKADATVWGEPAYPEAIYLVISVYDTEIRAVKAFAWDATAKDFIEVEAPLGET